MIHPRIYETVVLFSGKLDEATVEAETNKVKGLLETMGATIEKIDSWGRRMMEYEMAKQREGWYVIFTYTYSGEGGAMKKFARSMRIDENVLRELTVHREDLTAKRFRPKKEKPRREKKSDEPTDDLPLDDEISAAIDDPGAEEMAEA
jgi:small subunit ribosomal protein S6